MMAEYCIYFIIYGFLGWIYESLFYSAQLKKPVNTGFLHGCLCPIYGLACVANIALLYRTENNTKVFLISILIISAIEYAVSYILEAVFGKRWWDYTNWPCNLNGRISLISSLAFGILSMLQLRVIHPFIESGVAVLPQELKSIFLVVVVVCTIADLLYTLRRMNKEEERYWFLDEEAEFAKRTFDRIETDRIQNVKEYIKRSLSSWRL